MADGLRPVRRKDPQGVAHLAEVGGGRVLQEPGDGGEVHPGRNVAQSAAAQVLAAGDDPGGGEGRALGQEVWPAAAQVGDIARQFAPGGGVAAAGQGGAEAPNQVEGAAQRLGLGQVALGNGLLGLDQGGLVTVAGLAELRQPALDRVREQPQGLRRLAAVLAGQGAGKQVRAHLGVIPDGVFAADIGPLVGQGQAQVAQQGGLDPGGRGQGGDQGLVARVRARCRVGPGRGTWAQDMQGGAAVPGDEAKPPGQAGIGAAQRHRGQEQGPYPGPGGPVPEVLPAAVTTAAGGVEPGVAEDHQGAVAQDQFAGAAVRRNDEVPRVAAPGAPDMQAPAQGVAQPGLQVPEVLPVGPQRQGEVEHQVEPGRPAGAHPARQAPGQAPLGQKAAQALQVQGAAVGLGQFPAQEAGLTRARHQFCLLGPGLGGVAEGEPVPGRGLGEPGRGLAFGRIRCPGPVGDDAPEGQVREVGGAVGFGGGR